MLFKKELRPNLNVQKEPLTTYFAGYLHFHTNKLQ